MTNDIYTMMEDEVSSRVTENDKKFNYTVRLTFRDRRLMERAAYYWSMRSKANYSLAKWVIYTLREAAIREILAHEGPDADLIEMEDETSALST